MMCERKVDSGNLARILLFFILKENPEFCRLLLNGERPDYTLEDLDLASWGGEGLHDPEKEENHDDAG